MKRWPLHPQPKQGEALTSWLSRIAKSYQSDMSIEELLEFGLGMKIVSREQLNWNPPDELEMLLIWKTGVSFSTIRKMSAKGWRAHIWDHLEGEEDYFHKYVGHYSILLPPDSIMRERLPNWRPWPQYQAGEIPYCVKCSESEGLVVGEMLFEHFRMVHTCPSCESLLVIPNVSRLHHGEDEVLKLKASKPLIQMDKITIEALKKGYAILPCKRKIYFSTWLQMLRTVIEEINTALIAGPAKANKIIRQCWREEGKVFRVGLRHWLPYEYLKDEKQLIFIKVAARAISHLLEGDIETFGNDADLLKPIIEPF